jgi:hypothetical protein
MKRYRFLLFIFPVVFFLAYYLWPIDKDTIKILFIGNSYTYRNEMPTIFENIAISKGKKVFVEACTLGKATLAIQSKRFAVKNAISKEKWDVVIIQGSSRDFVKDSSIIVKKTKPALEKIIKAVQHNNPTTKMLFYMTWGYRNGFKPLDELNTFEKMSNLIEKRYLGLYKTYDIGVVPVGMVWKDVRKKRDEVVLYVKDGAHPSLKGSYLTACCFYSAIFNDSPVGSKYYSLLGPKICYFLQSISAKNVLFHREKYGLHKLDLIQHKKI